MRRIPEAMTAWLLPGGVLTLAVGLGAHSLYHWSHADVVAKDPLLTHKAPFLNLPMFWALVGASLLLWVVFAALLVRTSRRQDREGGIEPSRTARTLSALFLVVFALTISIVSFYLLLSLDAHWFSTMFAVLVFTDVVQTGTAFVAVVAGLLVLSGQLKGFLNENHLHSLGKMVFATTGFWAYIYFCQHMLIWYANLPEETVYFLKRTSNGWLPYILILPVLKFVVPFLLLISRERQAEPAHARPGRRPHPLRAVLGALRHGRAGDGARRTRRPRAPAARRARRDARIPRSLHPRLRLGPRPARRRPAEGPRPRRVPRLPLLNPSMKLRETLLGLLVLAAVLGGVCWARGRSRAGAPPRSTRSRVRRGGRPAPPRRRLPDVTLADASVDLGDVRIVLSAGRPIVAFAKSRFRVRAEKDGRAVPIGDGHVSFQMTMPMGDHRYSLLGGEDGWHEAEAVLPLCKSGKRTWFATVEGSVAGEPRTARFRLDLTPPSEAPAAAR